MANLEELKRQVLIAAIKKAQQGTSSGGATGTTGTTGAGTNTPTPPVVTPTIQVNPTPTTPTTPTATPTTPTTSPTTSPVNDNLEALRQQIRDRLAQGATPTGTTNVSGITGTTMPDLNIAPKVPTTATTSTDYYQRQLDEITKQREELKTAIGGTGDYAQIVRNIQESAGLDVSGERQRATSESNIGQLEADLTTGIGEANAIKAELQTIEENRMAEVEAARNRLTSMENISSDINEINYKYDIEKAKKNAALTTKLFELDLKQGLVTQAQAKINQIVADYTADKKAEVDRFDKLQSVYASWIEQLNSEEKTILDNAYKAAQQELETAKNDKKSVLELMIQSPMAGILATDTLEQAAQKIKNIGGDNKDVISLMKEYPSAGITSKDTIDQAIEKVKKYSDANPKLNTQIIGSAETGYSLISFDDKGNVKNRVSVQGGTGGGVGTTGLTQKQQEALAEDIVTTFDGITNREEAIKKLNSLSTYYSLTYGESGYKTAEQELNRLFPAPLQLPQQQKQISNIGAYQAGQAVKEAAGGAASWVVEPFERQVVPALNTFGSFLGGLFD